MLIPTILLLFLQSCLSSISHEMPRANAIQLRTALQIRTISAKQTIQIDLPNIDYEISGAVYESPEAMLEKDLYNRSSYQPSNSCQFYPTQLSLSVFGQIELNSDQVDEDPNSNSSKVALVIEQSFISSKSNLVYIVVREDDYNKINGDVNVPRTIVVYSFDQSGIEKKQKWNVTLKDLNLNDDDELDVGLFQVENRLIVTDQMKLVAIDINNPTLFNQITPEKGEALQNITSAKQNQLLEMKICENSEQSEPHKFYIAWENKISMLKLSSDFRKYSIVSQFSPFNNKSFVDVASEKKEFYALVEGGYLQVWRLQMGKYVSGEIKLESDECQQVTKVGTIIHIVCTESKMQYLAEFHQNRLAKIENSLILNRYYTQISDIKAVFPFGNTSSKLFLVGDDDLLFTFIGVNRHVLLDLHKKQPMHKYKSLGIQNMKTIKSQGTALGEVAIGVGTEFIVLFQIAQTPPQVQCQFDRKDGNVRSSLLIALNTTTKNQSPRTEVPQLTKYYQVLIPITFYIASVEVSRSKGIMITLLIIAAVLIIILFVMGCLFKERGIRNRAMDLLRRKLDKLIKERERRPLPIG